MARQPSFNEVLSKVKQDRQRGSGICAAGICGSKWEDDVNAAQAAGLKYTVIAETLIRLGAIEPGVSVPAAAKRVQAHFRDHRGDNQ